MTLSQFNCPHCHSPFQVETTRPSSHVVCPNCQQPVVLPAEPPVVEPPLPAPPAIDPPPRVPVLFSISSPEEPTVPPREHHEAISGDVRSRQIAAEDRATRRFIKNMIVWVCCAIVLISILAFFVLQGAP